MQKTLSLGAIGLKGWSLADSIELAGNAGFDSVSIDLADVQPVVDAKGIGFVRDLFARANVKPAFWNLGFSWADDEQRPVGLAALPKRIDLANQLGVPLAASGVSPASDDRDYAENLPYHIERLRPVAEALKAGGVQLALEFIGPLHYRAGRTYEFAYNMPRLLELTHGVGTGNLGLTLDIWHLYTSGGVNDDLDSIALSDVGIVHVNDAPVGIDRDEQQDLVRELPLVTGVLEIVPFMQKLKALGFDGPVMPEPFSKPLEELAAQDPLAAAKATVDSLNELWVQAGLD
ncbi:MAG: sugar phosphate isomerase/epimerase family protein [Thermomicrobiales bacterium]